MDRIRSMFFSSARSVRSSLRSIFCLHTQGVTKGGGALPGEVTACRRPHGAGGGRPVPLSAEPTGSKTSPNAPHAYVGGSCHLQASTHATHARTVFWT